MKTVTNQISTEKMDGLDKGILRALSNNAKMPIAALADRLNVSGSTVHVRLRRLEAKGYIRGAQLVLDYSKIGYDLHAFVGLSVSGGDIGGVFRKLESVSSIVAAYFTTGPCAVFLELHCKDRAHLARVIQEEIIRIPGISQVKSFVVLDEKFRRPPNFDDL